MFPAACGCKIFITVWHWRSHTKSGWEFAAWLLEEKKNMNWVGLAGQAFATSAGTESKSCSTKRETVAAQITQCFCVAPTHRLPCASAMVWDMRSHRMANG